MSDESPEVGRRPFAAFLTEHRGGLLHGELSDALKEVVLAAVETGKKGSLQVQITIEPNADGATVTISDKIAVKLPEAERGAAIFFFDAEGNLSRRDPRQMELPLRDASRRKAGEAS